MKKYILIAITIFILGSCKSKSKVVEPEVVPEVKIEKIAIDDVDLAQKKKAYELGKRVLMTCNTSRFKPFTTAEATPKVIGNTTEARLTKTCHTFRLKYGEFKDLRLIEVYRMKDSGTTVYRYKADYTKKIANKELRVTMDSSNRISALKSADWVDKFD